MHFSVSGGGWCRRVFWLFIKIQNFTSSNKNGHILNVFKKYNPNHYQSRIKNWTSRSSWRMPPLNIAAMGRPSSSSSRRFCCSTMNCCSRSTPCRQSAHSAQHARSVTTEDAGHSGGEEVLKDFIRSEKFQRHEHFAMKVCWAKQLAYLPHRIKKLSLFSYFMDQGGCGGTRCC